MSEKIKFNVEMELTKDQALAMQAFFERWNHLSVMGNSRFVAFYVDGDGNFKPNCKISCPELDIQLTEEMIAASNKKYGVIVDSENVFDFDGVASVLYKQGIKF